MDKNTYIDTYIKPWLEEVGFLQLTRMSDFRHFIYYIEPDPKKLASDYDIGLYITEEVIEISNHKNAAILFKCNIDPDIESAWKKCQEFLTTA